jgi:NADH:ubiquinone oxidoreductase subunit H
LCEAPFLLAAMLFASRWVASCLHLRRNLASLGLMGLGALAVQQAADMAVGFYLRHIHPADQLAHFATGPGLIYGCLLLIFAAMPIIVNRMVAPAKPRT